MHPVGYLRQPTATTMHPVVHRRETKQTTYIQLVINVRLGEGHSFDRVVASLFLKEPLHVLQEPQKCAFAAVFINRINTKYQLKVKCCMR
jgi:hypothetical protein